ncbi:hypothetical protein L3Q82_017884 [Scortum barcoo]|uniref:Uncharacterized protein n=1 Tax=Scortum barcoo TaxID=214431 RepID=A0ACB8VHV3_9TELE|nr:hypothetical protein L3Q82_017884 [Scortum barcoo]
MHKGVAYPAIVGLKAVPAVSFLSRIVYHFRQKLKRNSFSDVDHSKDEPTKTPTNAVRTNYQLRRELAVNFTLSPDDQLLSVSTADVCHVMYQCPKSNNRSSPTIHESIADQAAVICRSGEGMFTQVPCMCLSAPGFFQHCFSKDLQTVTNCRKLNKVPQKDTEFFGASSHIRLYSGETSQILSLAVVCTYGPNSSTEYPAFLDWGLGVPLRLGTPLFYWGTSTLTWQATVVIPGGARSIGGTGLPDLNPSGVLLLDFCASHSLSIMNTITCLSIRVSISAHGTRTP